MKPEDLIDVIGEASEAHVWDAKAYKRDKLPGWVRWGAAAACLVAVAGGVALLRGRGIPEAQTPATGGGGGHDAGTVFMSYAGPVFPLTLMEEGSGLEAERAVTYDFSTYGEEGADIEVWTGNGSGAVVRDVYRLTNPSAEDKTVTGVYPITGDYQTMRWPGIALDGGAVEYGLHSGSYSGGFTGTGDEHTSSLNLDPIASWEEYRALLADGSYFAEAFAGPPELEQPVTVYEFTDITDGDCGYDAATLGVHYRYGSERVNVMTYGFNGAGDDPETGEGIRSIFIREGLGGEDEIKYLIVVGGDIEDMRLQGYQDGGCDAGEEVEGPGATVARRESTMGEILKTIAKGLYDQISGSGFDGDHNRYLDGRISFDMYYADICKYFAAYGPMGTAPKERYSFEWAARLEDVIGETAYRERIFYLTFPITVPAGGSVELEVEQYKPGSFDFSCSGSENAGIEGYDMVTRLGSRLAFTGQRAAIENYEGIEIVRQNFGFDLEKGVAEVALDLNEPHYYLEVREIPAAEGG